MKKKGKILAVLMVLLILCANGLKIYAQQDGGNAGNAPAPAASAAAGQGGDASGIAFEVGDSGSGNSPAGIVFMAGIVGVCLLLCLEGLYSAVRKSRKRRQEMFDHVNKE